MTLKARIKAPLPDFFKKIRKWGLIVAGVGGAIVGTPVLLPTMIVSLGGYLVVAGTVMVAVSQSATVSGE